MAEKKTTTKEVKAEAKTEANVSFKGKYIEAVGKRKSATARIRLYAKGSGQIIVNGQPYDKYFDTAEQKIFVMQAIKLTNNEDVDLSIIVDGGGKSGQAEAVRNGIAKSLIKYNEELRPSLKAMGWLTRDARKKERKKPGLKKARRAPQWSKR